MMLHYFNETVQGAGHIDTGKECQDASCSWSDGYKTVIVVSDGHGGARHFNSAIGANLACQIAKEHLLEFCDMIDAKYLKKHTSDKMKELVVSIVAHWNDSVSALKEKGDVESFGCTLIAYFQTTNYWLALQIGDGRCVILDKDENWQQPIPWDNRCFLNMTTSLCDENAVEEFRFAYGDAITIPRAVFLGTDGIDGTFGTGELLYGFYNNILKSINNEGMEFVRQQLPEVLAHYSQTFTKDDMSVAGVVY